MTIKLTYFDIHGYAEPLRLLLVDKQIEFEDIRVDFKHLAEIKPKLIFGQLPCLNENGHEIAQSTTILRHLGRVHDLNGSNEAEATFIDMFAEGVRDLTDKYDQMIYYNYENGKDDYIKNTMPGLLANLEKLFKTHNNGEQYVIGEKVSYADYPLFERLDSHLVLCPSCLDNCPKLKAFHERFGKRPNLQKYLARRAALNIPINGNGKQ